MNTQVKNISRETKVLILSVFIAGLCSIIYELLIGTTSSYFLGDSVKQFSLTIGFYMAAMGIGSFLSRLIRDQTLLSNFIAIEILLGLLGGISVPLLYVAFAYTDLYTPIMFALIVAIGTLIGLEIPLLARIMESYYTLKINLSNLLSLDYLGALVATLLFPFVLLPFMGTFRSSLFFGMINMMIGFLNLWAFSDRVGIDRKRLLWGANIVVFTLLGTTFFIANYLMNVWTGDIYDDRVIYSKETPYQRIVLTKERKDLRLYLNGSLQFSSIDEYRYHEPLVHIPMSFAAKERILILGGGDGMAVREVLKHEDVKQIDLVDLDPAITTLGQKHHHFLKLNQNSLLSPKITIYNQDAFTFLDQSDQFYDLIISDLPDPNSVSLSRLYSRSFYKLVKRRLNQGGVFLTQATSPFFAQKAFWCINKTIASAGFRSVRPYHVNVPSFGEWGFVLASDRPLNAVELKQGIDTRFLNKEVASKLFLFENDLLVKRDQVTINTLDQPTLLNYYLEGWRHWN